MRNFAIPNRDQCVFGNRSEDFIDRLMRNAALPIVVLVFGILQVSFPPEIFLTFLNSLLKG